MFVTTAYWPTLYMFLRNCNMSYNIKAKRKCSHVYYTAYDIFTPCVYFIMYVAVNINTQVFVWMCVWIGACVCNESIKMYAEIWQTFILPTFHDKLQLVFFFMQGRERLRIRFVVDRKVYVSFGMSGCSRLQNSLYKYKYIRYVFYVGISWLLYFVRAKFF